MDFFGSYIVVLKRGPRHICLYEAPRSTLLHANKTTKKNALHTKNVPRSTLLHANKTTTKMHSILK